MYRLYYPYVNYNYGTFVVLTSIWYFYIGGPTNHMSSCRKRHGFDKLCILEIGTDRVSLYNT